MTRAAATRTPWRHGLALWGLLIACESVNGSVRELLLAPALGPAVAKAASFVVATLVVLGIATLFAPWLQATTRTTQLRIGGLWAALTVAFELALAWGRGLPLDALLADYDPARGGPMLLGLLVLLLAPWAGARLRAARLARTEFRQRRDG